jgi:hypothetical protein
MNKKAVGASEDNISSRFDRTHIEKIVFLIKTERHGF